MALIEYTPPVAFGDLGMSWENPDARQAKYVDAIRIAILERCRINNLRPDICRAQYIPSPFRNLAYSIMEAIHRQTIATIPYFVDFTVNDGDFSGLNAIPMLTLRRCLDILGDDRLYLPQPYGYGRENNLWLRQQYRIINLLRWTRETVEVRDVATIESYIKGVEIGSWGYVPGSDFTLSQAEISYTNGDQMNDGSYPVNTLIYFDSITFEALQQSSVEYYNSIAAISPASYGPVLCGYEHHYYDAGNFKWSRSVITYRSTYDMPIIIFARWTQQEIIYGGTIARPAVIHAIPLEPNATQLVEFPYIADIPADVSHFWGDDKIHSYAYSSVDELGFGNYLRVVKKFDGVNGFVFRDWEV